MARVLVLGGGFGGIAAALEARARCGDAAEVVLVDRSPAFSMGLRKLWEVFGIGTIAEGSRPRARLCEHGIDVRRQTVEHVDLEQRAATVDGELLGADFLVVALGVQPRPDLVPGLSRHGHDVWDPANVAATRTALEAVDGGRILIVIAGGPYPCPPAPFECAMLLDEWLRDRGLRERTQVEIATFQPMLLPNAGEAGSRWLAQQLDQREIGHRTGCAVEEVADHEIRFEGGDSEPFDLLIGIPPHRPPSILEDGFVTVDPGTLETVHEGAFAVGDLTKITLANGLPLPKAGVIAEAQGRRVGEAIAARILGEPEPPPFDGHGQCFIEMGSGVATVVDGQFFGEPEPQVVVREPSAENAAAKRRFESERLAAWFGGE
jgi:sulfide:quinone oxidoreductase